MATTTTNTTQYRLGQRVCYLTHNCDAEIIGFFMNDMEPSDPEANLHLTRDNIDRFPEMLLDLIAPDPARYFAIEIRFFHPGSFCSFEVRPDELQPIVGAE
ncbi:MAG: hypothetical protein OEM52_02895 [bacterium]|nr:hypothetical protein [bacterium]